jgi:hypothetical protein
MDNMQPAISASDEAAIGRFTALRVTQARQSQVVLLKRLLWGAHRSRSRVGNGSKLRRKRQLRGHGFPSRSTHAPLELRDSWRAVEIAVIVIGEGMTDRSGDSSKSPSAR